MAWPLKEAKMKLLISLFTLLPLLVFAQASDQAPSKTKIDITENARTELDGCVLAIDGNKINFGEAWMLPSPVGMIITDQDDVEIDFASLQAPFYAEVDIFSHNEQTYISRMQVLQQFSYAPDGAIIGEYKENETE